MRVVELVTSANWGGAQAQVVQYAVELSRRGATVVVACGEDGHLPLRAAAMGIDVRRLRWLQTRPRPDADLRALSEIENLIRTEEPDILHTHSSKAGVLGRLAASRVRSSQGRGPIVIHHCHGLAWGGQARGISSELFRRVERSTGHLCDGVISVSRAVQEQLLADGTYPLARHTVIHNGIEAGRPGAGPFTASSEQRRLLGLPTSGSLLVHVGRVVRGKGQEAAILAAEELIDAGRDVNLLIVGDGPQLQALRDQTTQRGDLGNRIHFLGFRTDVPSILRASDIFCLPSSTEGLPLVVAEAMAANLPVVATAVGGVPELVMPGVTGTLLDPKASPAHIAAAIGALLDDHETAMAMGRAGRARVERHFSLQNSARVVDFLYEMVPAAKAAA